MCVCGGGGGGGDHSTGFLKKENQSKNIPIALQELSVSCRDRKWPYLTCCKS